MMSPRSTSVGLNVCCSKTAPICKNGRELLSGTGNPTVWRFWGNVLPWAWSYLLGFWGWVVNSKQGKTFFGLLKFPDLFAWNQSQPSFFFLKCFTSKCCHVPPVPVKPTFIFIRGSTERLVPFGSQARLCTLITLFLDEGLLMGHKNNWPWNCGW